MKTLKIEVRYTQSHGIRGYEKLTETADGVLGWFKSDDGVLWVRGVFDGDYIRRVFTGIHDKHGKEIWEGDIVKNIQGISRVKWSEEWCAFRSVNDHTNTEDVPQVSWEIIGNIYENKDLLV